ncbi:MAG: hypothetical protein R3244_06705, partial [Thermoanaerobaculia bacterium]|nr:hypothetical protein [Thermoanaerobaculia bacterium]
MRRPSATLLSIGSVVVVLLVVLVVPMLLAPAVEADLVRLVAERSGIALRSAAFRFVPHRGWVAVDVEATIAEDGQTISAEIPRVVFAHRWSPLLRGRLSIDRVRLEAPTIDIVSLPPGRLPVAGVPVDGYDTAAEKATDLSGRVALEIDTLRIDGGRVVSRMAGGESEGSEIRGLDLVLEAPRLEGGGAPRAPFGLTSRGELRAESIELGRFALRDIAAGLEVERGRFRLDDVDVWSAPGRFTVDRLEIDLAQSPYR